MLYLQGKKNKFGEPIKGITRMEKLMFLASKETDLGRAIEYKFRADHYGPFDERLQDHLEALKDIGIVEIKEEEIYQPWSDIADEYLVRTEDELEGKKRIQVYSLTSFGMKLAKKIISDESEKLISDFSKIKRKFASEPIYRILHYVYTNYPEMTEKSRVRKKYLYNPVTG